ncbi:MAG: hypothetical protein PVF34_00515 [Gammaproteobacteria bacterium]|jgi:hypothetical protein
MAAINPPDHSFPGATAPPSLFSFYPAPETVIIRGSIWIGPDIGILPGKKPIKSIRPIQAAAQSSPLTGGHPPTTGAIRARTIAARNYNKINKL